MRPTCANSQPISPPCSKASRAAADVQDLRALLPATSRGRAKAAASARTAARGNGYAAPTSDIERVIAEVWQDLFGVERISLDDNFFELGGHSLLLVRAHAQLRDKVRADLPIVALLQYPTIRVARSPSRRRATGRRDGGCGDGPRAQAARSARASTQPDGKTLGRWPTPTPTIRSRALPSSAWPGVFPNRRDVAALWQNLLARRECISRFAPEELEPAHREDMLARANPNYVRARGVLADADEFDEKFFGFTPKEAEILDPQQRLFLEAAWEALEHAGYDRATLRAARSASSPARRRTAISCRTCCRDATSPIRSDR